MEKKSSGNHVRLVLLKCFFINQAEDFETKLFLMNKTPLTTQGWKTVHPKIKIRIYGKGKKIAQNSTASYM